MGWSWSDITGLGSLLLGIGLIAERVIGRLIRGQYVTRDELQATKQSISDTLTIERGMRADLDAKVKMMEVEMKHLPSADDVAELKDRMSELSQGQAVNNTELGHVREDLRGLRALVERLTDSSRDRG